MIEFGKTYLKPGKIWEIDLGRLEVNDLRDEETMEINGQ